MPELSPAGRSAACGAWRTAFRIVPAASRFIVSPNSYGFGAPLASMPVAISRVSCRPMLLLPIDPMQIAQRTVAEEVEALVGDLEADLAGVTVTPAGACGGAARPRGPATG